MRIDASHRDASRVLTVADYDASLRRLHQSLSGLPAVTSLVLCGSMAKDDLVPGWSDIDLIAFLGRTGTSLGTLDDVAAAVSDALQQSRVPLGLDLVPLAEFLRSHQLGGRPFMMTHEVAHYGRSLHGPWPFVDCSYEARARARVETERPLLIRSELHSWRRGYCGRSVDERNSAGWLFETAKVLLRILQCLTGPNLLPSLGARQSLQALTDVSPHHELLDAVRLAVTIRQDWDPVNDEVSRWRGELVAMSSALQRYEP
jgi:predicted nucleotidyltransferase